jgi:hypothetical protein
MISTRSVGLVIDTVVCLTLDKWETVSGQFGGYLKFLLDPHGLNIVEPVEEASGPAAMSAKVVNLASWSDDDCRSSLDLHEPQATDIVIALGYRH